MKVAIIKKIHAGNYVDLGYGCFNKGKSMAIVIHQFWGVTV